MDDFRWRELRVKLTEIFMRIIGPLVDGAAAQVLQWLDGVSADAVAAHAAGRPDLCEHVALLAGSPKCMGDARWSSPEKKAQGQVAFNAALSSFSATVYCARQLKPGTATDALSLLCDQDIGTGVADALLDQSFSEEEEAKDPLLELWQDKEERRT